MNPNPEVARALALELPERYAIERRDRFWRAVATTIETSFTLAVVGGLAWLIVGAVVVVLRNFLAR